MDSDGKMTLACAELELASALGVGPVLMLVWK
jgi:hypothetical protein